MSDGGQRSGVRTGDTPDPYREFFERSADAILIIDGGAFVDCNQATVDMLRARNREHILNTHPSELSPPFQPDGSDSFTKANEMIAIALELGSNRFEWAHVRADGEVFPVEVLLTAMPRGDGWILHVVWRDITARKQLEEHLRLTQKMEAVGRMAGSIAHDFNNMLVAIIGNSDLLAENLASSPEDLACIDEVRYAANRAADLVRQLMAFSRKQDVQTMVVDVSVALREIENILHKLLDARYQLDLRLCEGEVHVLAGLGEMEQIVTNLVTNARDAMPDGGQLTVELRRLELSGTSSGLGVELRPGAYAVLTVFDTGHGMAPDVVLRAFDPFFTTKAVGKGAGLGLATVYAIAKHCGGGATIQSDVGHGTVVRVYLPVTAEEVRREEPRVAPMPKHLSTQTVLVVEDEPTVATLEVRVLRAAGYRVLLARDGLEALDVFGSSRVPIDIVITDVVMPRLGGVDLLRRLRAAAYQGAVLMTSGYTNDALASAVDLGEEIDLLEKPFTTAALLARTRRALERGRGRSMAT